jgi:hypothetical protein
MSADNKLTFMCDDAMAELLAKVAFHSDKNKSEIIRACVLLAIDTVAANPALINKISISDRISHQTTTR